MRDYKNEKDPKESSLYNKSNKSAKHHQKFKRDSERLK
jgi:hypothetical protein